MREKLIAGFAFLMTFCLGMVTAMNFRAQAAPPQINAVQSTLTLGYHELWNFDLAGIAKVPQCSKAAGCAASIQLCNQANLAGGGCILIAGNGANTYLNVSVSDLAAPAGSTAPVETNFPIATLRLLDIPGPLTNSVP